MKITFAAIAVMGALLATGSAQAAAVLSDIVVCNGATTLIPEAAGEQAGFLAAFCGPFPVADALVNLLEADGSVSDQIWTQAGFFYFVSDDDPTTLVPNAVPTGYPVVNFGNNIFSITENGTPQDVSAFFGAPPNFVTVQSDATPEPSTWLLGASVLALVGLRRFRRA